MRTILGITLGLFWGNALLSQTTVYKSTHFTDTLKENVVILAPQQLIPLHGQTPIPSVEKRAVYVGSGDVNEEKMVELSPVILSPNPPKHPNTIKSETTTNPSEKIVVLPAQQLTPSSVPKDKK